MGFPPQKLITSLNRKELLYEYKQFTFLDIDFYCHNIIYDIYIILSTEKEKEKIEAIPRKEEIPITKLDEIIEKGLIELFKVLDTPLDKRDPYLEDDLNQFYTSNKEGSSLTASLVGKASFS